jgi:putative transposase
MKLHLERKRMRLPGYNYSMPGAYFVTACTMNRALLFDTPETKLALESAWHSLLDIFANIELDEFVVMPNHVHCILCITREGPYRLHAGTWKNDDVRRVGQLPDSTNITQFETLSNIIGAFKTTAATRINKLRGMLGTAVWQKSFYERIVRNQRELEQIQKYISHNPIQWKLD